MQEQDIKSNLNMLLKIILQERRDHANHIISNQEIIGQRRRTERKLLKECVALAKAYMKEYTKNKNT